MNDEMKAILIDHVQYVPQKTGCHYVIGLPAPTGNKKTTLRSAQQLVAFLGADMGKVGSVANHAQKAGHSHGAGGGCGGTVRSEPAFMVCECQHAKAIPWVAATTCYYGIKEVDFVAAKLDRKEASKKRCELRKKTQKRSKEATEANAKDKKRAKAT